MTRVNLTPEEAALILTLREAIGKVESLSAEAAVERREWEAAHPGDVFAALTMSDSKGAQAYTECIEAMVTVAKAGYELVAKTLGVTGWQASVADLELVKRNRGIEGPFGLYCAHDALYPQYDVVGRVAEVMGSEETVRWLGDQAEKMLAERDAAPRVRWHWHRLVAQRDALPPLPEPDIKQASGSSPQDGAGSGDV